MVAGDKGRKCFYGDKVTWQGQGFTVFLERVCGGLYDLLHLVLSNLHRVSGEGLCLFLSSKHAYAVELSRALNGKGRSCQWIQRQRQRKGEAVFIGCVLSQASIFLFPCKVFVAEV